MAGPISSSFYIAGTPDPGQPSTSGIPAFTTDDLAKVSKPAIGTMTFSIATGKIWIYDGATWQSFTKDP